MKDWVIVLLAVVCAALILSGVGWAVTGFSARIAIVTACEDSDNGIDFNTKGVATFTADGEEETLTDDCMNIWFDMDQDKYLKEYFCADNRIISKIYRCGGACYDGACVPVA